MGIMLENKENSIKEINFWKNFYLPRVKLTKTTGENRTFNAQKHKLHSHQTMVCAHQRLHNRLSTPPSFCISDNLFTITFIVISYKNKAQKMCNSTR